MAKRWHDSFSLKAFCYLACVLTLASSAFAASDDEEGEGGAPPKRPRLSSGKRPASQPFSEEKTLAQLSNLDQLSQVCAQAMDEEQNHPSSPRGRLSFGEGGAEHRPEPSEKSTGQKGEPGVVAAGNTFCWDGSQTTHHFADDLEAAFSNKNFSVFGACSQLTLKKVGNIAITMQRKLPSYLLSAVKVCAMKRDIEALKSLLCLEKRLKKLEVFNSVAMDGYFSLFLPKTLTHVDLTGTVLFDDPLLACQLRTLALETLILDRGYILPRRHKDFLGQVKPSFLIDSLLRPSSDPEGPANRPPLFKSLKHLSVKQQEFVSWEAVCQLLQNCDVLEEMYLTHVVWWPDPGARPVAVQPLVSKSLKVLDLNLNYVVKAPLKDVVAGLTNLEKLTIRPGQVGLPLANKDVRIEGWV